MAENVILAEQELTFTDGVAELTNPIPFALGETYKVIFDGTEYTCDVQEVPSGIDMEGTLIGNGSGLGLDGNDEPFMVAHDRETNTSAVILMDSSSEETHTVAIYQVAEEVGIITRDRDFNETEHYGIETVTLDTTDGGTQVFSKGQAVEGVEIALDFSGGEDMTVNAADGTLIESAVIKKPADLVPEKIAKGAKIAGIEGTVEPVLETLEVTENGTFTPSEGVDGFSIVTVDVKSPNICYIGTDAPDPAIGNDGDLYIVKG